MNVYLKQYQKNEVETASPEKVLILLYDGAINFLNKAKIAIEENDTEQSHKNIMACEKIILEFMNTLDIKEGNELAKNLYSLYDYLYNALVQANMNQDIGKVEEVLRHLKSLRETWSKAIEMANAEKKKEMKASMTDGQDYYLDRYKSDDEDGDEYYDDDDNEDDEE